MQATQRFFKVRIQTSTVALRYFRLDMVCIDNASI
jgi:hypothetical protein